MQAQPGDNAFWRFSLTVYRAPGVAEECLALQDTLGIDVNLLLYLAWLGAERRVALTPHEVEAAGALAQPWHDQAVRPLRAVRRQLKAFPGADNEVFRRRVKALELEAERMEQAMLFDHALKRWPALGKVDARAATTGNIAAYLPPPHMAPRVIEAALAAGG